MDLNEWPLSDEDQMRIEAMPEHERAWEEEATRTFGPPDVRDSKNRRYTERLIRKHSEPAIRGMLKALSKLKDPMCCSSLRKHKLDSAPLHSIIRFFELLGLHFRAGTRPDQRFTINISESYGTIGSGGEYILEKTARGTFRIVEYGPQQIC
jgi:hypothetical protein